MFRALSVFPGPFTLDAAEAVAGEAARQAVLHLVNCSLLVPPRAGPDGRSRYSMLEALRGFGATDGWPRPASKTRRLPRWPGGRWKWRSRPPLG